MATYWENSCSFGLRYVSWYKYLIVSLVFSHLGFWSGNLFLIAPFPDLCLLVPFYDGPDLKLFILVGWGRSFLSVAWPTGVQLVFFFAPELVGYSAPRDLHRRAAYSICESLFLIHQDVYHDLFVCS